MLNAVETKPGTTSIIQSDNCSHNISHMPTLKVSSALKMIMDSKFYVYLEFQNMGKKLGRDGKFINY